MKTVKEFREFLAQISMLMGVVSVTLDKQFYCSGKILYRELASISIGLAAAFLIISFLLRYSHLSRLDEMNQHLIEENQRLAHENQVLRECCQLKKISRIN